MVAGVHQDRGLAEPMESTADQTDVGMAKEDHGRMMFTECQVFVKVTLCLFQTALFSQAQFAKRRRNVRDSILMT